MSPETDVQQKWNKVREHTPHLAGLASFPRGSNFWMSAELQGLSKRHVRAKPENKKQIICDLMLGSPISYTSPVTIDEGK